MDTYPFNLQLMPYKYLKVTENKSYSQLLFPWQKPCDNQMYSFSGAINIHPSLLPQWKGAAPMSHAILTGAKETGVSIVEVSRGR